MVNSCCRRNMDKQVYQCLAQWNSEDDISVMSNEVKAFHQAVATSTTYKTFLRATAMSINYFRQYIKENEYRDMYRKEVKANLQVYHGLLDRDPRARVKA